MANVSSAYRSVWSTEQGRAAAQAASTEYENAATKAGEHACFVGGVTYGSGGAAESANFSTFRQCGKQFGNEVAKPSKK